MPWVLLDVLLGLAALGVLAGLGVGLYRHVRALMRLASTSSTRISEAMPPPVEPAGH